MSGMVNLNITVISDKQRFPLKNICANEFYGRKKINVYILVIMGTKSLSVFLD